MFGCYIVSIIMNIFLNWILLFLSCIKKSKQYIRDVFYILIRCVMNRELFVDILGWFYFLVICIATLFITKIIFLKNERNINKKLMLVWLIDAILNDTVLVYVIDVYSVVSIVFFVLFEMLVKVVIIRYLLKISRKKSLLLSIVSSLLFLVITCVLILIDL